VGREEPDFLPRDIAEACKARSGRSGPSAYVAEAEHGPVTDEDVQSLRDQLHQAREQPTRGGADAACPVPPPFPAAPWSSAVRGQPRLCCGIAR